MKNQAAFIPDNISNISSASQPFPNPFPHESTEFHPDSTDNLVEEILRQRAERLNKEKNTQLNAISTVKIEQSEKEWKDEQEIEQKEQEQIGQQTSAQPQKQPKDQLQLGEGLNNHSNDTISHSSFKEKHSQSPNDKLREDIQTPNNQDNHPNNSLIEGSKHEQKESASNKSLLNKSDRINDESVRMSVQQEASVGEKSMQLNLSLSPSDKKYDKNNDNSSIEQKASSNSSKRNDKLQLEMNNLQQSIHSQQEGRPNIQSSNHLIQQQIGANESKIQAKSSILQEPQSLYTDNKGFYDFTPLPQKNETDRQVVKALTQHLQTIDKIDNEQFSNQKTFRKSEKLQQQPQHNLSRNEFLDINKQIRVEEFQTDYSENQRENKILQHRFQSNLQYEIGQLREMIELYEALIANEECKQLRKGIKDLQMRNRREKIALRAASYTKIFNFHSPIAKNNTRPIQFRTKFVISQRLAGKYHQTKKKIAEEKKLQVQLQDKYQVLNDYYDMMKQRKIQVYQESLKEFQYNSKIQKYQTVKNSFFTPVKETSRPKSEYEFNKTKRTIEMENAEVPYFQVLRYKKDINKDMILEFEVWNLSKLKKLRDSNNLVRKEIQYVDQQIIEIDNKLLQMFGIRKVKSSSKDRFSSPSSRYHIEPSSKSISKSPQSRLRRPATAFSSPQKLNKTSSIKDYDSPASKTSFKRQEPKEQLLLIDSVQLDFSKRKAMRIFQQMDDYGISPIIEESKVMEDNPTLIKKQSKKRLVVVPKPQSRSKGKNLVRTRSKEIKTETSLTGRGAMKGKSGKMSEQVSPQKTVQSEYYTSMQELYPKGK